MRVIFAWRRPFSAIRARLRGSVGVRGSALGLSAPRGRTARTPRTRCRRTRRRGASGGRQARPGGPGGAAAGRRLRRVGAAGRGRRGEAGVGGGREGGGQRERVLLGGNGRQAPWEGEEPAGGRAGGSGASPAAASLSVKRERAQRTSGALRAPSGTRKQLASTPRLRRASPYCEPKQLYSTAKYTLWSSSTWGERWSRRRFKWFRTLPGACRAEGGRLTIQRARGNSTHQHPGKVQRPDEVRAREAHSLCGEALYDELRRPRHRSGGSASLLASLARHVCKEAVPGRLRDAPEAVRSFLRNAPEAVQSSEGGACRRVRAVLRTRKALCCAG